MCACVGPQVAPLDAMCRAPDRAGGKTLYFVTTETSDVLLEAMRFCAAHLPSLDLDECARNLSAQEAAMRAKTAADRQQARLSPTLTLNLARTRSRTRSLTLAHGRRG